ncbi:MAG: hypothetical protein MUQ20_04280 [Deltaproteobacteria bacterium]|nr:hypothetical protein [Deltaproteobacteria bacterium]
MEETRGLAFGPLWRGIFLSHLWSAVKNFHGDHPTVLQPMEPGALSFFILSLPIEELGWAHGIGFTWPLFMAYVSDGRVQVLSQKNPSERGGL